MNPWDKLIGELAAHNIEIGRDGGITIHRLNGSKQFPAGQGDSTFTQAVKYVLQKAQDNSEYLLGLWRQLSQLDAGDESHKASNESTKRLFVSALKHLAHQATLSSVLVKMRINVPLLKLVLRDVNSFSQSFMSRVIDFRLAIDWVTHLVQYDRYRALLIQTAKRMPPAEEAQKVASAFPTDYSYESAVPWSLYREGLHDVRNDQTNPMTEDRDPLDANRKEIRFADQYEALVGHQMIGQPTDPLLPNPNLATEDQQGFNGIERDINAAPRLWDDPDREPGAMRQTGTNK